jgi:hypothetical protein
VDGKGHGMETLTAPDDTTVYVDQAEGKRGSKGPFFVVYASENRDTRWGFYCGNCETLDNAVDAMGRVQCNECSNRTKAEEWDAAHE